SSQNGRGGLFYVIDDDALSTPITDLITGDTAPSLPLNQFPLGMIAFGACWASFVKDRQKDIPLAQMHQLYSAWDGNRAGGCYLSEVGRFGGATGARWIVLSPFLTTKM